MRSNIEVQIRNTLSEVLILSLKCSEKSALLYLVFCFCRLVEERGGNRVKLTDLLECQENIDWLQLSWKEISDELSSLRIFEVNSENYIQIESRLRKYLTDICGKVERYWNFISGLYSKREGFKNGIEGEIKKGVLLFNEGFYFECHEFLEEGWRREKGKEKFFLQGLIHAAVALYHLEYENYKGTASYLRRSYRRLKEFESVFLGVDVKTFLAEIEDYLRSLEKSGPNNLQFLKSEIPKIRLIE
jgi:uncharacterized protein